MKDFVVMRGDVIQRPDLKIGVLRTTFDKYFAYLESPRMTRERIQKEYNESMAAIRGFLTSKVRYEDLDKEGQFTLVDHMITYYSTRFMIGHMRIPLVRIGPTLNPETESDWELY